MFFKMLGKTFISSAVGAAGAVAGGTAMRAMLQPGASTKRPYRPPGAFHRPPPITPVVSHTEEVICPHCGAFFEVNSVPAERMGVTGEGDRQALPRGKADFGLRTFMGGRRQSTQKSGLRSQAPCKGTV